MKKTTVGLLLVGLIVACSNGETGEGTDAEARAPVTTTSITRGTISDSVSLSATTYYLSRFEIAAPVNGYIRKAGLRPGDRVGKGDVLFELVTREAGALKSADASSGISDLGKIPIKASSDGFLSSVFHVEDDYVQEGTLLAKIVHADNLYFKLFVPYEYQSAVKTHDHFVVELPSGEQIRCLVTGDLNELDAASQATVWLLKPEDPTLLPEGLNLLARVETDHHENAQLLPKEAVLADETLHSFWVMKVVDDSLAIEVPVTKGIETEKLVEIVSPDFSPSDLIITSGQYGLEDSSRVQIKSGL